MTAANLYALDKELGRVLGQERAELADLCAQITVEHEGTEVLVQLRYNHSVRKLRAVPALARLRALPDDSGFLAVWFLWEENRYRRMSSRDLWAQLFGAQTVPEIVAVVEARTQRDVLGVQELVIALLNEKREDRAYTFDELDTLHVALRAYVEEQVARWCLANGYLPSPESALGDLFGIHPETEEGEEGMWHLIYRCPVVARKLWGVRWAVRFPIFSGVVE